jgi:hypothetical protein
MYKKIDLTIIFNLFFIKRDWYMILRVYYDFA